MINKVNLIISYLCLIITYPNLWFHKVWLDNKKLLNWKRSTKGDDVMFFSDRTVYIRNAFLEELEPTNKYNWQGLKDDDVEVVGDFNIKFDKEKNQWIDLDVN